MSEPTTAQLAEAIASEEQIAEEAAEIREKDEATVDLTPDLFMQLYPLLRRPIPSAFIQHVPKLEKGKPYASTGVRSVQVQIDRMNNVLTPMWWWLEKNYSDGGKLCEVTVYVGKRPQGGTAGVVLAEVASHGGVAQGSGGNLYKGSFTNAAKPAFARLGPGHEVYLGAADLDPDVNREVAEQKGANGTAAAESSIGVVIAGKLVDRVWSLPAAKDKLQLAASHVAGRDVGDCGSNKKATEALASLAFEEAERVDAWIAKKEFEAALPAERVEKLLAAIDPVKPQLAEGGQNWIDGLVGLLASLGIKGKEIDPSQVKESLGRLTGEEADQVEARATEMVSF